MKNIKTILLTTDFSDTSRRAVEPALVLARKFGAKIILAHVTDLMPPIVVEYTAIDMADLAKRQKAKAHTDLASFAQKTLGRTVKTETVVVLGTPHVEIVNLAKKRKVDVIVMATHGGGFFSDVVLGSTTDRVLRHAPCPVFIVRDPRAKSKSR